eukprot:TRINITY_DN1051_c1_g1_i1.p1 TRINITY_DN1051_c1_g1~~TRINITY_DN1051_c1_g1_i1.p1  ORF type:complete len:174 (+),score=79.78 TRINITY_DN1051_c1_g1_i1:41-523(+)
MANTAADLECAGARSNPPPHDERVAELEAELLRLRRELRDARERASAAEGRAEMALRNVVEDEDDSGSGAALLPPENAGDGDAGAGAGWVEHAEAVIPGDKASQMPADDIAACKRECRRLGCGGFHVMHGTAFINEGSPAACSAAVTAGFPTATAYVVAE